MRRLVLVLCIFSMSSLLSANTLYTCKSENSTINFSTSSVWGKPIFNYSDQDGYNFNLMGNSIRVEESADIKVFATFKNSDRFKAFRAVFPILQPANQDVRARVNFIDTSSNHLPTHFYVCDVKRVAF